MKRKTLRERASNYAGNARERMKDTWLWLHRRDSWLAGYRMGQRDLKKAAPLKGLKKGKG